MSGINLELLSNAELLKKNAEMKLPTIPITPLTRPLIIKRLQRVLAGENAALSDEKTSTENKRRETIHITGANLATRSPSRSSQRRTLAGTPTKIDAVEKKRTERATDSESKDLPILIDDDDEDGLVEAASNAEKSASANVMQTFQDAAKPSINSSGKQVGDRFQSQSIHAGTVEGSTSRASPAPVAAFSRYSVDPSAAVSKITSHGLPAPTLGATHHSLAPRLDTETTSNIMRRAVGGVKTTSIRHTLGGQPLSKTLQKPNAQRLDGLLEEFSDDTDLEDKPFASEYTRRLAAQYKNDNTFKFQAPLARAPRTVTKAKINQDGFSFRKYAISALLLMTLAALLVGVYYFWQ